MNSRLGPGGRGFDAAYTGLPPWDIGRPQQAYVELVQTGKIHGSVLDVGCGTGEHALYLAQHGHEAWGIDAGVRAGLRTAKRLNPSKRHHHQIPDLHAS